MSFDILIFAAIAVFLLIKLNSVLGTRSGQERERPNPFLPQKPGKNQGSSATKTADIIDITPARIVPLPSANYGDIISADDNKDGRIDTGLTEITAADARFDTHGFISGARAAFEMIVSAYAKGDLETLKPLLSPKLFEDFSAALTARHTAGHQVETVIHRILHSKITEAHLGGTMAYITVNFAVEETTATRDSTGKVIDGDPDKIFDIEDVWTFTRDTRAEDPNWVLIETRTIEK